MVADGLAEDWRTIQRMHTLDAPRPPMNPLARLIGDVLYVRKSGESERFTPSQARYSRQQQERKARQRAIFLGLCAA